MKIQVLSDLHNEYYNDRIPSIPPCDSDVVILAGDIGAGNSGVEWANTESKRLGKPIVYVAGNHEYFDFEYYSNLKSMRAIVGSGVTFLENDSIEINGVRILGCTLWSDFSISDDQKQAMLTAEATFHDYKKIQIRRKLQDRSLTPDDTLFLHQKSAEWLRTELDKAFPGKTVVVTHFAPSINCQHPAFALDHRSAYFMADLDDLVGMADLWVFGHTHHCYDEVINGTRVVANQQGYPFKVVSGFNPVSVISL